MTGITDIALPYQKAFLKATQRRKIWLSSRQIGKTWTLALTLCATALKQDNGLSLCISTGAKAASEIIMKCIQFAKAVEVLTDKAITFRSSFDGVKFSNGSRVLALPSSTDGANLRGWTVTGCVAIDEAAFIRNLDSIMQAIAPTLSRSQTAQLVIASTPAGKNGKFYDMWKAAQNDPSWYAQSTTIHDAILAGLDVDLDSLHKLCPDREVFAQEYECVFQSSLDNMLDPELIEEATLPDYAAPAGTWLGIDIGRQHDRTSIVAVKQVGDKLYVDSIKTLHRCEYQKQLDEFAKHVQMQKGFVAGYIDAGGIGSAVAEFAGQKISPKLKPFVFTGTSKTPAYELFRSKVMQRGQILFSPEAAKLARADVLNVSRIVTESGQVRYTAESNAEGHGDIISGIVLALQAWHDFPIQVSLPIPYARPTSF